MRNVAQLLEDVRISANGMLPSDVYAELYRIARQSSGGTFVEIGTAHGAATISLALGGQQSGQPFRIHTADLFSGRYSSRAAFGSVADNVAFVQKQFERFGVASFIELVVGDSLAIAHQDVRNIQLLFLDADGRIDRDFAALCDRLADNCCVIVDDVDDAILRHSINGISVLDQKHRIGHLLTRRFLEVGILQEETRIHNTAFYRLGPNRVTAADIGAISLPEYRKLVFAEIDHILPNPS